MLPKYPLPLSRSNVEKTSAPAAELCGRGARIGVDANSLRNPHLSLRCFGESRLGVRRRGRSASQHAVSLSVRVHEGELRRASGGIPRPVRADVQSSQALAGRVLYEDADERRGGEISARRPAILREATSAVASVHRVALRSEAEN